MSLRSKFHPVLFGCLLLLAANGASASILVDCTNTTCITQLDGTIQLGGSTVTIPTQFVQSANPQQPDTFWINSPGMPQNLTIQVPLEISVTGFVTFKSEPWMFYDLFLTNDSETEDLLIDILWTPDVAGAPFYTGVSWFTISATGTAGPNPSGGYMQTVTFGSTTQSLGSLPCTDATCSDAAIDYWPFGQTFNSMTVALDLDLAPGASVEVKGFAGLDVPEPGSFQLLAAALLGLAIVRGRLRRKRA